MLFSQNKAQWDGNKSKRSLSACYFSIGKQRDPRPNKLRQANPIDKTLDKSSWQALQILKPPFPAPEIVELSSEKPEAMDESLQNRVKRSLLLWGFG